MIKKFDQAYFDRWYRGRRPVISDTALRRKVNAAVSLAEYFLRRPIRNVIDVGCGEAAWFEHLKALRPAIRYAGYDPSEYAVERFGASRNVRQAGFGDLGSLGIRERFDLLVCSDVLHYLQEAEIRRGLPAAVRLMRGLAFVEVMTAEEDVVGDTLGLERRPARWYREIFGQAGLYEAGPYMWNGRDLHGRTSPLETRP